MISGHCSDAKKDVGAAVLQNNLVDSVKPKKLTKKRKAAGKAEGAAPKKATKKDLMITLVHNPSIQNVGMFPHLLPKTEDQTSTTAPPNPYYYGNPAIYGATPMTSSEQIVDYQDYITAAAQYAAAAEAYQYSGNQSGLLNNAELDYFEQFLGNITAMAANMSGQSMESVDGAKDGIAMNPIIMNNHPYYAKDSSMSLQTSSALSLSNHPRTRGPSRSYQKGLLDPDTKRAHHIASEHKRRGRIRAELMRLNDLVPGLQGNSRNSQSKILSGAADFLESVLEENTRLKAELDIKRLDNPF